MLFVTEITKKESKMMNFLKFKEVNFWTCISLDCIASLNEKKDQVWSSVGNPFKYNRKNLINLC